MSNEKLDWKPEVGKTAWAINRRSLAVVECLVNSIYGTEPYVVADVSSRTRGGSWLDKAMVVYPTPEAALAANPLKVYDLEGKEVLIPRASVENSEAPTKLSKEREMELLNLAIAYADADYQQKDGADRAWHHVATARERLIAFVENREPELDDEY